MNSESVGAKKSYVIYIWILLWNLHMKFIGKLHMNSNVDRISEVSSWFIAEIRKFSGNSSCVMFDAPRKSAEIIQKRFSKHVRHIQFSGTPNGAAWAQIRSILEQNLH